MNTRSQTLLKRQAPGQPLSDENSRIISLSNIGSKGCTLVYNCTTDGATGAQLQLWTRVEPSAPWVLAQTVSQGDLDSSGNYALNFVAAGQIMVTSVVNDATVLTQDVQIISASSRPMMETGGLKNLILEHSDGHRFGVDVYLPDSFDPGRKYPLWFFSHGSGGDRRTNDTGAKAAAANGIIAVTVDARGMGTSINLNDQSVYGDLFANHCRMIFDTMELPELIEAEFLTRMRNNDGKSCIDSDRIIYSGTSNGGVRSFIAAAYSGVLPSTLDCHPSVAGSWRDGADAFPTFYAVLPNNIGPDQLKRTLRFSQITHNGLKNAVGAILNPQDAFDDSDGSPTNQGTWVNPATGTEILSYYSVGNISGFETLLTTDARFTDINNNMMGLLQSTNTHILANNAYDDFWGGSEDHFTVIASKTGGDYLLNLNTGGHGTPENNGEEAIADGQGLQYALARLFNDESGLSTWFDESTLATLDQFRMAIVPDGDAAYQRSTPAFDECWALNLASLDGVALTRFYFRAANALGTTAPGTSGNQSVTLTDNAGIDFTDLYDAVAGGADPATWLMTGGTPRLGITNANWSATISPGVRLVNGNGRGTARLFIGATDTEFDVAVSLWLNGTRFIVLGYTRITGHPTGTIQQYDIPLQAYGFDIANNDSLEVRVEPVCWQRPPYEPGSNEDGCLKIIPYLENKAFNVYWGSGQQSYIDLPLLTAGTTNI